MSNPEEEQYAIVCGYEYDPCDLFSDMSIKSTDLPEIIAESIPFTRAAHVLRTLLEQGQEEMRYYMIPTKLWGHFRGEHEDGCNV